MVTVSVKYTGQQSETTRQDWLVLEQEDVPSSQQICTVNDLRKMLSGAMVGQSARSYVSDACPIKRRIEGSKVIISYDATVLVHRSSGLFNNYDLIPSEGRLSIRSMVQRSKKENYELKNEALVFLGWLPVGQPQCSWLTKVFNVDKVRIFAPALPDSDNGYLYFPEAYKGHVEVSGHAIIDKYRLTIDHQQGAQFDKTILLTAEWGPEDEYGNRESVQIEVNPPQCWIDEANKCADPDLFAPFGSAGDGDGDGDGEWNYTLNAGYTLVYIGFCGGEIKKTERVIEEIDESNH